MGETSANEPLRTHRNFSDDIETGECPCPGKSMAETYVLAMRCPAYRWRESHPGFRTELENLACDDKGKGASGSSARPKVPMRQSGADCLVVPMRRSNVRGGKGVGHPRRDRISVPAQNVRPVANHSADRGADAPERGALGNCASGRKTGSFPLRFQWPSLQLTLAGNRPARFRPVLGLPEASLQARRPGGSEPLYSGSSAD
jgi:hypothetical protein